MLLFFIVRYLSLIGESQGYLNEAFAWYPSLKRNYTEQYINTPLRTKVEDFRKLVVPNNFSSTCLGIPPEVRKSLYFPWFDVS